MATPVSYNEMMASLHLVHGGVNVVIPYYQDSRLKHLVENARSCAVIGCGTGELELAFIEHCMPSLEVLSAVEPDSESVVELRANIARRLPNVRSTVYQDMAENWAEDTDQVFDVVTIIQCLNDIPEAAHLPLFKRLFDSVIRPNGFVVMSTRTERLDGTKSLESRIMEALNHRPYDDTNWYKEARRQMESVGFINCYESRYNTNHNLEKVNRGYFAFHARECDKPITLETVEQIIRNVIGDAKTSRKDFCLGVFRKPNWQTFIYPS